MKESVDPSDLKSKTAAELRSKNASLVRLVRDLVRALFLAALIFSLLFVLQGAWAKKLMQSSHQLTNHQMIRLSSQLLVSDLNSKIDFISSQLESLGKAELERIRKLEVDARLRGTLVSEALRTERASFDSMYIDFTLWEKGASPSAFDLNPPSKRISHVINEAGSSDRELKEIEHRDERLLSPSVIQIALQGQRQVVSLAEGHEQGAIGLVVVPLSSSPHVLAAHIRLDYLRPKWPGDAPVFFAFIDDLGRLFLKDPKFPVQSLIQSQSSVQPTSDRSLPGLSIVQSPLYQAYLSAKTKEGELHFSDSDGRQFVGGFEKLGGSKLVLLSLLPQASSESFESYLWRTSLIGAALFWLGAGFMYLTFHRRKNKLSPPLAREIQRLNLRSDSEDQRPPLVHEPKHCVLLWARILRFQEELKVHPDSMRSIEVLSEEEIQWINRFEGEARLLPDGELIAYWILGDQNEEQIWKAIRCAIELCGNPLWKHQVGIHAGRLLLSSRNDHLGDPWAGEVIAHAKALSQIAINRVNGSPCVLVSNSVWEQTNDRFSADQHASADRNSVEEDFFEITGYRDERGDLRRVSYLESLGVQVQENLGEPGLKAEPKIFGEEDSSDPETFRSLTPSFLDLGGSEDISLARQEHEEEPKLWWVKNGEFEKGPYTREEISARLFAQEFDFDSLSSRVPSGGKVQEAFQPLSAQNLFGGSRSTLEGQTEDSYLWVYDGVRVEGPMSQGFLKAALVHGAIQPGSFLCVGSTLSGWHPVSQWIELEAAKERLIPSVQSVDPLRKADSDQQE